MTQWKPLLSGELREKAEEAFGHPVDAVFHHADEMMELVIFCSRITYVLGFYM